MARAKSYKTCICVAIIVLANGHESRAKQDLCDAAMTINEVDVQVIDTPFFDVSVSVPNNSPLDPSVRTHPIFEMAKKSNMGKRWEFVLPVPEGEHIDNSHMPGEQIQSVYIMGILKQIFQNATFKRQETGLHTIFRRPQKGGRSEAAGKDATLPITLDVRDTAESTEPPSPNTVPMEVLKLCNPAGVNLREVDVRKSLGIPESLKIVSVYSTREIQDFGRAEISLSEFLIQIGDRTDATKIFISRGGFTAWWGASEPPSKIGDYSIVKLSQLKSSQIGSTEKMIIINDTTGKMLPIYRISNLAVILGPINFIEPLMVGTPTALVWPPKVSPQFDRSKLAPNIEFARQMGAFGYYDNVGQFLGWLPQDITTTSRPLDPRRMIQENGQTPVYNLLTLIQNAIASHTGNTR